MRFSDLSTMTHKCISGRVGWTGIQISTVLTRWRFRRSAPGAARLLWAIGVFQWSISAAATDERRIEAVQSHVLPPVLIDGESARTQTLTARMAALHVPGVSIAVIHDGKIDWARGFGLARPDGTRVTTRTPCQACSISKPVSATAILRLAQEGKLDLDVDVNTYLKRWNLTSDPLGAC